MTKISRNLPNNQYQASVNAESPNASNPFVTKDELNNYVDWNNFTDFEFFRRNMKPFLGIWSCATNSLTPSTLQPSKFVMNSAEPNNVNVINLHNTSLFGVDSSIVDFINTIVNSGGSVRINIVQMNLYETDIQNVVYSYELTEPAQAMASRFNLPVELVSKSFNENFVLNENYGFEFEVIAKKERAYDLCFAVSDETTQITTGITKIIFDAPRKFRLFQVKATLRNFGDEATVIDVNVSGSSILANKVTIDALSTKSISASVQPTFIDDATFVQINENNQITVDIDSAGTNATGLKIYLIGYL